MCSAKVNFLSIFCADPAKNRQNPPFSVNRLFFDCAISQSARVTKPQKKFFRAELAKGVAPPRRVFPFPRRRNDSFESVLPLLIRKAEKRQKTAPKKPKIKKFSKSVLLLQCQNLPFFSANRHYLHIHCNINAVKQASLYM